MAGSVVVKTVTYSLWLNCNSREAATGWRRLPRFAVVVYPKSKMTQESLSVFTRSKVSVQLHETARIGCVKTVLYRRSWNSHCC